MDVQSFGRNKVAWSQRLPSHPPRNHSMYHAAKVCQDIAATRLMHEPTILRPKTSSMTAEIIVSSLKAASIRTPPDYLHDDSLHLINQQDHETTRL